MSHMIILIFLLTLFRYTVIVHVKCKWLVNFSCSTWNCEELSVNREGGIQSLLKQIYFKLTIFELWPIVVGNQTHNF